MEASLENAAQAAGNRSIAETFVQQRERLRAFIRRRVPDPAEADDILQDVFHELVESTRVLAPIEQVGAWLFRVARNRIVDRFRRRQHEPVALESMEGADGEPLLDTLLPARGDGPEAAYARQVLIDELAAALDELPPAQRDVFIAHEIEGRSFNDLVAETGVGLNTLLARKRYAVLHLRRRLQAIHDEFVLP